MKIVSETLIVITTWLVGVILILKIIITIGGFLVITYQIRGQVIESGGWAQYFNKLLKKWKK